jgi:hypothetical protein
MEFLGSESGGKKMIKISSSLLFIIWITIALTACSTDKAAVSSIIPSISPSDRVNATSSPTEEEKLKLYSSKAVQAVTE